MQTYEIEHTVDQKREGKLAVRMWLLLALYLAVLVVGIIVVFKTVFIAIGAIIPLVIYTLVLCTWRFVDVEQKCVIEAGELVIFRKFGNSKPKATVRIRLKNAEKIAPYESLKDDILKIPKSKIYDARPSSTADNIYAVIYEENGKKRVLLLQVIDLTLRKIRYYNDNTGMMNLK